jgi:hypothetical protein
MGCKTVPELVGSKCPKFMGILFGNLGDSSLKGSDAEGFPLPRGNQRVLWLEALFLDIRFQGRGKFGRNRDVSLFVSFALNPNPLKVRLKVRNFEGLKFANSKAAPKKKRKDQERLPAFGISALISLPQVIKNHVHLNRFGKQFGFFGVSDEMGDIFWNPFASKQVFKKTSEGAELSAAGGGQKRFQGEQKVSEEQRFDVGEGVHSPFLKKC